MSDTEVFFYRFGVDGGVEEGKFIIFQVGFPGKGTRNYIPETLYVLDIASLLILPYDDTIITCYLHTTKFVSVKGRL